MHLGSPSPDISLDLWRDVNKIGCCDTLFSSFIVNLFCVGTPRDQAITIKRDPLTQVFVTVLFDPGAFAVVGFVRTFCVTVCKVIQRVSESTLVVRWELLRFCQYLL